MAEQTKTHLFSWFGFVIWGDFADLTMYRSQRHKFVFFPKTYPDKPPSPDQLLYRDRFRAAAAAWRTLTEDARGNWELVTKRASLCCTGYNLFVFYWMTGDTTAIETLERQTGVLLLPI